MNRHNKFDRLEKIKIKIDVIGCDRPWLTAAAAMFRSTETMYCSKNIILQKKITKAFP